jgi:hypothetical protein
MAGGTVQAVSLVAAARAFVRLSALCRRSRMQIRMADAIILQPQALVLAAAANSESLLVPRH